jgi:hypothetical protein
VKDLSTLKVGHILPHYSDKLSIQLNSAIPAPLIGETHLKDNELAPLSETHLLVIKGK